MKLSRWTAVALLATTASGVGTAGAQDEPVDLDVASFSQTSSWYAYAVGLAKLLRGVLPEGSIINTPPEGGGTSNALLVDQGKFDMAFGMASVLKWAEQGDVVYDEPITSLRSLVGGLDQYYLAAVATGADQPKSLDAYLEANPELRVILRQKGSSGAEGGIQMLTLSGHSPEQIEEAGGSFDRVRSFGIIKDALVSDRADFWVHTITAGHPATTEIAQSTDVSFLQPSDEVLAEMQNEYGWTPATMPAGTFRGQDEDVRVPGTTTNLFVREDFPAELAYTITKTICENIEQFQSTHQALSDFTCADAWRPENNIIPLHPGAERYYREAGLME